MANANSEAPLPPPLREAEYKFRKESTTASATRMSTATNRQKGELQRSTGVRLRPCPSTGDPEYTENQCRFLVAVEEYRRLRNRNFLNVCDYLDVAESLGWQAPNRTWPSDRVYRIEVQELSAIPEAA